MTFNKKVMMSEIILRQKKKQSCYVIHTIHVTFKTHVYMHTKKHDCLAGVKAICTLDNLLLKVA